MKDRQTRKSKGVAFILYLHRDDALKCVQSTNQQKVEQFLNLIGNIKKKKETIQLNIRY